MSKFFHYVLIVRTVIVFFSYFEKQPEPLSGLLLEGLFRPLRHLNHNRSRSFATTSLEQQSFIRRQPIVLQVSLPNQDSIDVEVDAWTTAEELADRILRLRGITDSDGWGIEYENGKYNGVISGDQFLFDALSQLDGYPALEDQENPFIKFKNYPKNDKEDKSGKIFDKNIQEYEI